MATTHYDEKNGVYLFREDTSDHSENNYEIPLPDDGYWMVTSYGDSYNGRLGYTPETGTYNSGYIQMGSNRYNGGGGANALDSRPVYKNGIAHPVINNVGGRNVMLSAVRVENPDDIHIACGMLPSNTKITIDLPDDDYWVPVGWGPVYSASFQLENTSNGWLSYKAEGQGIDAGINGKTIFHNNDGFKPQFEDKDSRSRDYYLCLRRWE
jgi:hypothetical protein